MKKMYKYALLLSVFVTLSSYLWAQVTIQGTVTNAATKQPIDKASVQVLPNGVATFTNSDGSFQLFVPSYGTAIRVSSVGFTSQDVTVNASPIQISLQPAAVDLGEVVVVAYGTRKKTDLTGSVTSVTARDFQKGTINSSEQLLVGKVPGLEVTSGGGAAGGGSKIRIRGGASLNASNDPLIVIDGVPVEGNSIAGSANILNTINPNDIESISVLKDASATALYGSRASNGVIIVNTKKGRPGKWQFNYNAQLSLSKNTRLVKVLSADEIKSVINTDAAQTGINTFKNLLGNANTDWQDLIYQNAIGFNNNLSARGSVKFGEKAILPLRASLGYLSQEGTLLTNKFDRITGALNLNPVMLKNHLQVNVGAKYTHTKNRIADEGAIGSAVNFDPTQDPYNTTGKWGGYYQWLQANGKPVNTNGGAIAPNPLSMLNLRNNVANIDRLLVNANIDYKFHFLPDLHLQLNAGLDKTTGKGTDRIDSLSPLNWQDTGRTTQYKEVKENTLIEVSLYYAKKISDKFSLDALLGHSYQDYLTTKYNFASYNQKGNLVAGTTPQFPFDKPEFRIESYYGRLNLNYEGKYLLTASLRRDASSKFSPDNRVGYFPALAFAWKIKDDLLQSSKFVNDLKLRLGYGKTGQQDGIDYYSYLVRYNTSLNAAAYYQLGDSFYSVIRPLAYNKNLTWEKTTTTNIGFDYALLNNRISGSLDFYWKKTTDLLSIVPTAPGANFGVDLLDNVGNMENKGVEFAVFTTPVRKKDFTWELNANFTYQTTKITKLLKQPDSSFVGIGMGVINGATANRIGMYAVGYAPNTYYVYKQIYDANGKPVEGAYEDLNKDGTISSADQYFYKKPAPDFYYGISTQVTYKKFSIGLAAHGAIGNYVYNNLNSNSSVLANIKDPLNVIRNAGVNYNATHFKLKNFLSDYYIENASFFRIDNINFGYNVGKVFKDKASMRLSANIQNVAVFSKYSGLDPEISSTEGIDNNIYPRPMIATVGVSIDF